MPATIAFIIQLKRTIYLELDDKYPPAPSPYILSRHKTNEVSHLPQTFSLREETKTFSTQHFTIFTRPMKFSSRPHSSRLVPTRHNHQRPEHRSPSVLAPSPVLHPSQYYILHNFLTPQWIIFAGTGSLFQNTMLPELLEPDIDISLRLIKCIISVTAQLGVGWGKFWFCTVGLLKWRV